MPLTPNLSSSSSSSRSTKSKSLKFTDCFFFAFRLLFSQIHFRCLFLSRFSFLFFSCLNLWIITFVRLFVFCFYFSNEFAAVAVAGGGGDDGAAFIKLVAVFGLLSTVVCRCSRELISQIHTHAKVTRSERKTRHSSQGNFIIYTTNTAQRTHERRNKIKENQQLNSQWILIFEYCLHLGGPFSFLLLSFQFSFFFLSFP